MKRAKERIFGMKRAKERFFCHEAGQRTDFFAMKRAKERIFGNLFYQIAEIEKVH